MSIKRFRRTNSLATWALLQGICIAAYFLYTLFVVPLVEVAAPRRAAGDVSRYPVAKENNDHHRWFRPEDWERQPCSILHTSQGKILFDDFEVVDPQTWFVKPFSLVLEREKPLADIASDATEPPLPPLILRCHAGARLNFDRPVMQQVGSNGNRLKQAFLQGKVELYRLNTAPGKDDAIRIETSNVQITDERIVTIDDVAFWFGKHQGIGRNLSIQLGHSTPRDSVASDFSNVNGIEKLELAHLTSLRLLPSSSPQPGTLGKGRERLLSTDQTPIEITAGGPFEFDLLANLARFVNRVQVRKLDADGDTLQCNELLLKFRTSDGVSVFQLDAPTDTQFELESITALGGQHEPAVLDAHSQNARAAGERLEYDLVQQTIAVSGRERVEVRKDTSRFVAKSIVYHLTEDQSLGSLQAKGPGQMVRDDGQQYFRATWNELLSIQRQTEQQHAVRLTGNTEIRLDRETSIRAEQVELLLWEVPVFNQANEFVGWSHQPSRLVADRNVHITSERMNGDAVKLVADWPANPQAAAQDLSAIDRPQQLRHDGLANVSERRYRVNRIPYAQDAVQDAVQDAETTVPIHVSGREINVVLAGQNGESQLVDLRVQGDVVVSKSGAADRLEILGDQLRLVPQGPELFQIRVAGAEGHPANVASDRLQLSGPEIILDQQQNSMWVNGAGQLEMKGQPIGQSAGATADAKTPFGAKGTADQIRVAFSGGMVFDGFKIYFENQVAANIRQAKSGGALSTIQAFGNALSLTLDRRVSFIDPDDSSNEKNPQVVAIVLRDRVPSESVQFKQTSFKSPTQSAASITNRSYDPQGILQEQFTIVAPHTEIDNLAQTMVAYGPGSVQIHRHGGEFALNTANATGQNRQSDDDGLTYIHVDFGNRLTANSADNRIDISGNLRCLHAPVQNFDQIFDPDRVGKLPADAIRLDCDHMVLAQSQNQFTGQMFNQVLASGNAEVQSSTFRSTADRFRYDQQTDLLTVESESGGKVALEFRRDTNSNWQKVLGAKLTYRLSDQQFTGDKVDRITGTFGKPP